MAKKSSGINRRDFIKASAAAIGGGLVLFNSQDKAGANVKEALKIQDCNSVFSTPKRLSDTTHQLAQKGLSGEWGRAAVQLNNIKLEDVMDVSGLSEDMRYANCVKLIAERAPVWIEPGEKLAGWSNVNEAIRHSVPIYAKSSISHVTIGFDRVLKTGTKDLRRRVDERIAHGDLDDKGKDFLQSMRFCLDAMDIWHRRYLVALKDKADKSSGEERENYLQIIDTLRNVPQNPPSNFREAIQSLWFMHAFQRLCGNWSGIGRFDQMLGPYLKHDLNNGTITLDEARELIAHFWVKGTQWIGVNYVGGSGDAQSYQNIVLGGIDAQGKEVTNEVTYLVMDVVEELHISDYPIAVRLNKNTPEKLLRRMAEVQRHGGGIVAMYNEDVVIKSLTNFGYPLEEAREFANDGCWEAIIPGKTSFIYNPFDTLLLLQNALGISEGQKETPDSPDFESLYAAYHKELQNHIDGFRSWMNGYCRGGLSTPLLSLFVDDCIEKGRGYYERGPKYTVLAPHAGGIANTANSLLTIKKLVYDEKMLTLKEFADILRSDWKDQDNLRRLILSRSEFYGNDNDEADNMVKRVYDDYTDVVGKVKEQDGVLMPAGISTFGREIEWRKHRKATADGHNVGEILATNFSPSPGTDKNGPTAMLRSYCKMDYTKLPNIGTIELKVLPDSVKGDKGIKALVGLMKTFVDLGGCFMHIDVVDSAMLLDAQRHPEKYPNLSVRIAGWSARFATLDKNWQDMVINRTQQVVG